MKTLLPLIIIMSFAIGISAQTSLASYVNEPMEVELINGNYSNVLTYSLTTNFNSSIPNCSRNYQYKDLYFIINLSGTNSFKFDVSFSNITDHGVELYTLDNGNQTIISCIQSIDSTSSLTVENIDNSIHQIYGRIWINEIENDGRVYINISNNFTKSTRGPNLSIASANVEDLVQNVLISGCVEASNVSFIGHPESIGLFTNGNPGLDFNSGIILSSGSVLAAAGPNNSPATCTNLETPGDSLLSFLISRATFDAAILEFDFVPANDFISFQYAFGSEEYEEYVGNVFNDIFTFHISGGPENYINKNIALIPGTNTPVSINNVNQTQNTQYYYNNDNGEHIQYDGMTHTLTAVADVTPCETYHIRLSIADAADPIFDSGVFLKAGSFSSGTIPLVKNYTEDWVMANTTYEGCSNELVFTRSDNNSINEPLIFNIEITGTAQTNLDYSEIPTSIEIPAGQEFISIPYSVFDDGVIEGQETIVINIITNCSCGIEYLEKVIYVNDPIDISGEIPELEPVCENDTVLVELFLDELPENYRIIWSTGDTDTTAINVVASQSGDISATVLYPCNEITFSTFLEVNPAPDANVFTSSPGCIGDDISFSAENGDSYLWKGPDGFFTTESEFILENAQSLQSGIYSVTVTGENDCNYIESLDIQINEFPVVQLSEYLTVCENSPISINPGNYFAYQWSGPQNWMSYGSEINISSVSMSHAGVYHLTVSDEIGCQTETQTELVVNPTPESEVLYSSYVCFGENTSLQGSGEGTTVWFTPTDTVYNSATIDIVSTSLDDDGTYTFVVKNEYNCYDTTSLDLHIVVGNAEILTDGVYCTDLEYLDLESTYSYGTWDAPNLIDSINGILDLSSLETGVYDITYSIDFDGCSDSQTSQITIQETITAEIEDPGILCSNSGEVLLNAFPDGGQWQGEIIIDSNLGIIDPVLSAATTTMITYEYSVGVCNSIDSIEIGINDISTAEIFEINNLCYTDESVLLTATPIGGVWSGNGIINSYNGRFDPISAGVGTHTVYYQITNNNCVSVDSIEIQVDSIISAEITSEFSFCSNSENVTLSSDNQIGIWTGFGIINSDGTFSPSAAGVGSGYVYHEIINGACIDRDSIQINVEDQIIADFSLPIDICLYDQSIEITPENSGGIWYGDGIIDSINGSFNPQLAGIGTHQISYQLNNNGCISNSAQSIIVLDAPNPSFTSSGVYCNENVDYTLIPDFIGGQWSGNGITNEIDGVFNPDNAELGMNHITYTVSNENCISSQTQILWVIDGTESITTNFPDTVCINATELVLNANPDGGIWTGIGVINDSIFIPQNAGSGHHTLDYQVGNSQCQIVESFEIFVQEVLIPNLISENEFCSNSEPIELIADISVGEWSGEGVIDNYFHPQIADTGVNFVDYQHQIGSCISSTQFELLNHNVTPVEISLLSTSYCQNAEQVFPSFSPEGGVISGISVSSNNSFYPSDLPVGQNTVMYTFIDEKGCSSQTSQTVEILEVPEVIVSGIDSIYCHNSSDVAFHAYPPGGTFGGFEVSGNWFSPSLLSIGVNTISYYYTAPNGCSNLYSQNLTIANSPEIFIEIIQPIQCYNDSSAIIQVSSINNDIETVLWSDYNNTSTQLLSDIPSGIYYVTATNNFGCETVDSIFVPQLEPFEAIITGTTQIPCSDSSSGIINLNVSGGEMPYDYIWSDDHSINLPDRQGLSSGDYTVTVVDSNNCNLIMNHTIEQSNAIDYEINIINHNSCYSGNHGSVEITIENDCELSWFDGNQNNERDGLTAGVYYFSITNSQNCVIIDSIFIHQPEQIIINELVDSVTCGNNLGSISITTIGGTPPYNIFWSTDSQSSHVYELPVGNYVVTVEDANNCQETKSIDIFATNSIDANIEILQTIPCFGDELGVLQANSENGQQPLSYLWSNNNIDPIIHNTPAGIYSVTITDHWGCEGISQDTLDQPDEITYRDSIVQISCFGDNTGQIQLNTTGGVGELSCTWNDETVGFIKTDLYSGIYNFTITDMDGCTKEGNIVVPEPLGKIEYDIYSSDAKCFGENSGSLEIDVIGGTPPYAYLWEVNNYIATTKSINNLYSGDYSFTITDANDCNVSSTIKIKDPLPIDATISTFNTTCNGKNDGQIIIYPTGGLAPYQFMYNNTIHDSNTFSNLSPGNYAYKIIDNNQCVSELYSAEISNNSSDCIDIPNTFTPNSDGINDYWEIANIDMFPDSRVQVFNRWGQLVFETRSNDMMWDGTSKMGNCPTGTYLYNIELHNRSEPYQGYITLVR